MLVNVTEYSVLRHLLHVTIIWKNKICLSKQLIHIAVTMHGHKIARFTIKITTNKSGNVSTLRTMHICPHTFECFWNLLKYLHNAFVTLLECCLMTREHTFRMLLELFWNAFCQKETGKAFQYHSKMFQCKLLKQRLHLCLWLCSTWCSIEVDRHVTDSLSSAAW